VIGAAVLGHHRAERQFVRVQWAERHRERVNGAGVQSPHECDDDARIEAAGEERADGFAVRGQALPHGDFESAAQAGGQLRFGAGVRRGGGQFPERFAAQPRRPERDLFSRQHLEHAFHQRFAAG
jgi:hypothetical protein